MRLTNEQLLLLLAFVGDDGLTVSDLSDRLAMSQREANWRLRRLEKRGWVTRGGRRGTPGPNGGSPARVWLLAVPLALTPAEQLSVPA